MQNKVTAYLIIFLVCFSSCKKSVEKKENTKGDVVAGTYSGSFYTNQLPEPSAAQVIISKAGTGQYKLATNAPFSSFNFGYDALSTTLVGVFTGDIYYNIPKQTNGNRVIDSSSMTYYMPPRSIQFIITNSTRDTTWNYSGTKQ